MLLEISQNSPENTYARVSFLIKLQVETFLLLQYLRKVVLLVLGKVEMMENNNGWKTTATLLKKMLWHRCFPVNFAKFLRATFLQSTSGRLLLN